MKRKFQVTDLCRLDSLQGVTVLTGTEHLDNEIEHINVMEVPDIDNWVQKNEFLMTTGYMFMNNPEKFVELIPNLKEKGVAALGIKTKRFIYDIPEAVINCANECQFPLLLLPEQTTFSIVIRECMEHILISEKEHKSMLLKKLLTGDYTRINEILNGISDSNLNYKKDTLFTILMVAEKEDHVMYQKESLYHKLAAVFRKHGFECHHVMFHNHLIILLSYKDASLNKQLDNCHKEIIPHLRAYNGIMCEYDRNTAITKIPESYNQLKKMEKVIETCHMNGFWICLGELGLYSAIPEMRDSLFYYYCKSKYIDPLIDYDTIHDSQLLDTLRAYYACNCNMKETAQQMYTHYNTICHRLEKIQELLDLDLHSFYNQCTLYLSTLLNEPEG